MPLYCYRCRDCEHSFEARHSMSFEKQACLQCQSFDVFKVPSLSEVKVANSLPPKAGKVVDEYIRDTKKEIRKEKQKLRSQEL